MLRTSRARRLICIFFFNDTATTEIYTLSLHDALPIYCQPVLPAEEVAEQRFQPVRSRPVVLLGNRSEEHTSELQSQSNLVCRLLLEKKKKNKKTNLDNTKTKTKKNNR